MVHRRIIRVPTDLGRPAETCVLNAVLVHGV